MDAAAFFGSSFPLTIAAIFIIVFSLLGAFDGLYFHIYKFKLHRLPEAWCEHAIHGARGALFVPISLILFAYNTAGWLLWLGLVLLGIDLYLEVIDVLVEKEARRFIGGIHPEESALHVTATGARVAAIALVLGQKGLAAYSLSSPPFLPTAYPPFLALTGLVFAIGTGFGTISQIWSMIVVFILRSEKPRGISNEGNPIDDYDIRAIYLAMPIALALEGFLRWLRPSLSERHVGNAPPEKAILYTFHQDALLTLSTRALTSLPKPAYIGYHGVASYFPTLHYSQIGIRALRYALKGTERPKDSIIRQLNAWDGLCLIRTDSGKPYRRVRASLVDMALATGRPLVPVAQRADRFRTLFEHTIPRYGACVTTHFGEPIHVDTLAALDREQARQLLQQRLESL